MATVPVAQIATVLAARIATAPVAQTATVLVAQTATVPVAQIATVPVAQIATVPLALTAMSVARRVIALEGLTALGHPVTPVGTALEVRCRQATGARRVQDPMDEIPTKLLPLT